MRAIAKLMVATCLGQLAPTALAVIAATSLAACSAPASQQSSSSPSPSSPSSSSSSSSSSSVNSSATNGAASAGAASSSTAAEESHWTYSEDKDEMRGVSTKYAFTDSVESFGDTFGNSSKHTTLTIRREPNSVEVEIINKNLQFTCNSFTNTHVAVKFDDGPVTHWGCTNAEGDVFGVAFINPGSKFLAKAKQAKKVIIEAEVYQKGPVQQTFELSGLKF